MQVKKVPISQQDFDKIVHMDNSATHWSLQHSQHQVAAVNALSTYENLVAAKNQCVSELVKASGIKDMSRVVQARLVKDGKGEPVIEIAMHDDPAAEEPAPAVQAAPEAPAS